MSQIEAMFFVTGRRQIPFAASGPRKDGSDSSSYISPSLKAWGCSSSRVPLSVEQTNRDLGNPINQSIDTNWFQRNLFQYELTGIPEASNEFLRGWISIRRLRAPHEVDFME